MQSPKGGKTKPIGQDKRQKVEVARNLQRLLEHIYFGGAKSDHKLSDETGMDRKTIKARRQEALDEGYLNGRGEITPRGEEKVMLGLAAKGQAILVSHIDIDEDREPEIVASIRFDDVEEHDWGIVALDHAKKRAWVFTRRAECSEQ